MSGERPNMAIDEILDESEMRVLLYQKAQHLAAVILAPADHPNRMKADEVVNICDRMKVLADALPPDIKQ
jgi:hypothetical protein